MHPRSKFCLECGAPLGLKCPACGTRCRQGRSSATSVVSRLALLPQHPLRPAPFSEPFLKLTWGTDVQRSDSTGISRCLLWSDAGADIIAPRNCKAQA